MKKVVIYPGRFQPMLPHHAEVYKKLQAQFPGADVYVATSDKVEMPKSPFNFKEKVAIMTQLHDIPANRIIQAKSPYLVDSYTKSFDQENTMVIFAVGAKDEDRFPMKNVDPNTGLDMTIRGEPRPKFYQMINTLKQHPALPMSERGYIYHAPIVDKEGEVASASAFRNAFANAVDVEQQKEVFTKYMGKFDNGVFELLKNKMDNTMKEELNKLKFLAGLLSEAPISWDSEPEDDDEDFKPGFTQDNMVNQLGKIADSEEASKDAEAMKVKKFKVADTVITDDGKKFKLNGAEAKALLKMFNMLSSQRAGEEESPREKFNRSIQQSKGLQSMLDFARAKGLVQEDASEMPTVNFDDMRSEYGIEESDMSLEDKLKDAIAQHKEKIEWYNSRMAELEKNPEFQNADDDEKDGWMWDYTDGINVQDEEHKLEHFLMALADHQENGATHWWQGQFVYPDTAVRDDIAQELRDMGAWAGDVEESVQVSEGEDSLMRTSCKSEQECKDWANDILKAWQNSIEGSEENSDHATKVDYRPGEEHVLYVSTSGRGSLDGLEIGIMDADDFSERGVFGDSVEIHAVIKADGEIDYNDERVNGDLSELNGFFKVEEGSGEEHHCKACDGSGCEKCDDTGIDAHFRRQEESSEGGPTPSQMSDEDLADYIGASVEEVRADREGAEEAANDKSRDYMYEAKCGCCGNDPCDCPPDCEGCKSMEETKMSKTAQEYYDMGVEHGKKGIYKNPPYGIGAPALKAYSKGVKAGEAMKEESVDESAHILDQALADLKKLAGI